MIETMLLAAGLSTRLYPLTQNIPKPLLPFMDRKLLDFTLDYLQSFGVSKISTNAHHGVSPFMKELGKTHQVEIRPFIEDEIMGTGGGIKNMKPFITRENFMVVNCDFITDIDLKNAYDFHVQNNALATLVLIEHVDQKRYGEVGIDANHRIVSFPKRPHKPGQTVRQGMFTGIHFIHKRLFDLMPDAAKFCIVNDVYQPLMEKGEAIFGYRAEGRWMDVGEKDVYAKTQFELLKKPMPWMKKIPNANAPCSNGIVITSPALIGNGVKLLSTNEATSRLGPNVIIGDGATIEENVSMKNCIVFPNSLVEEGSTLEQMIITKDTIVHF